MYFRVTIESIENLCYLAFLLWCLLFIILHKNSSVFIEADRFLVSCACRLLKRLQIKARLFWTILNAGRRSDLKFCYLVTQFHFFGVQCWLLFLTICPRESQALMVCSQLNSLIHDAYPSLLSRQLHFLLASRQLNFRVTSKQLV